ncbi:MAG: TMEM43 family protein [Armatimonadota bacterium]
MPDSYTEVTRQSCGQNIVKSCVGTLIGLLLFIAAFPVLWWNEQRSLEREQALNQGERIVVTADAAKVNPGHDGKLVYLTGDAVTAQTLKDSTFGIAVKKTLRLQRLVEMYQWEEEKDERTEKEVGGGSRTVTTYEYKKIWSDDLIDSGDFKHPEGHKNPAQKPYDSTIFEAADTRVGAFALPQDLQAKLRKFTPYPITGEQAAKLPVTERKRLKVEDGRYYRGADPASPQIGDARVTFSTVPQGSVSLVARQLKDTFEAYGEGNKAIHLIEQGTVSAKTLFQHAKRENLILTWVLRGVGALMMIIGIALFFGPINALANVLPFVGNITEAGTGCVAGGIGLALSIAIIAVAWVTIRPLLGIPLFVVTIGLIVLVVSRGRKRRQNG